MNTTNFPDERLELIFTCCHPALSVEAQVALTLRTLGGLTTDEIARAFLVPEQTMAKRLVRAKHKIKAARIDEAREAYLRAKFLIHDGTERRFLERRLNELHSATH